MLFGKTPEAAAKSPMLRILGGGFEQSIHMVAAALGFALDPETRTRHEMAVATAPIDSPIGPIAPGTRRGAALHLAGHRARRAGRHRAVNWLMGEEHLDPPWSFGPERERFEVEIIGDPPAKVTFHGLHPTDLRAAPEAQPGHRRDRDPLRDGDPVRVRAEPGILTYLDLPLVHGRADASLTRSR